MNNYNYDKIIFHIDVNSAFLSWTAAKLLEEGEITDIRTIPAIIGGDSEKRHGIVLAKSIPAKKYGIETAEPIVSALKKCPSLIIKPCDYQLYQNNSQALMEELANFCPDIEQVSIDECFMDFTSIAHKYSSATEAANIIRKTIKNKFGFTVNIGISNVKVLAKMASDFEKPDKTHTLFSHEIKEKMWPLPVSDLFMCGKSSSLQLYKLGIRTIGDLANYDLNILELNLKNQGRLLYNFANGIDSSEVSTTHERLKGIGNSITLSKDITNRDEALVYLKELAAKVSLRLSKEKRRASMINLEIKYSNFTSCSHQKLLERPIDTQRELYENSLELFDWLWNKQPIRLLGIRTSKLSDYDSPYQMNIFDYTDENIIQENRIINKERQLNSALDKIRNKYGDNTVTKGYIKK